MGNSLAVQWLGLRAFTALAKKREREKIGGRPAIPAIQSSLFLSFVIISSLGSSTNFITLFKFLAFVLAFRNLTSFIYLLGRTAQLTGLQDRSS